MDELGKLRQPLPGPRVSNNGRDYVLPDFYPERSSFSQPIEIGLCEKEDKGLEVTFDENRITELMNRFKTTRERSMNPVGPTEFRIQGFAPKGASILFTGAPKGGGKTTFLIHALAAVVDGEPFLDLDTEKTTVVYLTEQGRGFETEYLEPVGLMDRDDFVVLNSYETSGFQWPEVVEAAVRLCVERNAGILVVDTASQFARLQGDGENSAGTVLEALRPLQEAAQRHNLTIIIVHHDRKGGGHITESGRGSSAYAQAVDVILNIRQPQGSQSTPNIRELQATGRYTDLITDLVIELTPDGYVSHGERAQVARIKAEKAVLDVLPHTLAHAIKKSDVWDAIKEAPGFGKRTVEAVLKDLAESGKVHRQQLSTTGNPYVYWLPDGAPSFSQRPYSMVAREEELPL